MSVLSVGVVVIGRNEGERLLTSLRSVVHQATPVVYVDSGSVDQSLDYARTLAAAVVELDPGSAFTAARARNSGFQRLREMAAKHRYVQFVDGDCQIADAWLGAAAGFLDAHPEVAAVCGRLREKYPENSVYNLMCDIEWDRPCGETKACGGIAMMRVSAFESSHGYRTDLIAGEEPELCVRLRAAGWKIWRLDVAMATHDAAITRFGQWWARSIRTGYAFAQGRALHGAPPERHGVRESRSAWLWGLGIPAIILIFTVIIGPWALALALLYPLQILRLASRGARSATNNWWWAFFLVLGKFPEMVGQFRFLVDRCLERGPRLIEYK
jgi:glycosyltransferase involved in cell wall biosynthesis